MIKKILRRSQAIVPFGIGAMIDYPDGSYIIAGLDKWTETENCRLDDERLAKRLKVAYFIQPPESQEGAIPLIRFPLWYQCKRCGTIKAAFWNDRAVPLCDSEIQVGEKKPCAKLPETKKWKMIPLRFIVACENGHIEDFPWIEWTHSNPDKSFHYTRCNNPTLRITYSRRAGLEGIIVRCETCGKKRSLAGASMPGSLKGLTCSGNHPWLGPEGKEECNRPLRMLQRGGSNVYFAKVASSILIPPYSDKVRGIIDDQITWDYLTGGRDEGGKPDSVRINAVASLKKLDERELTQAIFDKLAGQNCNVDEQDEQSYRYAEYKALSGPPGKADGRLLLNSQQINQYQKEIIEPYFDRIALVEKLAETRVLTGFSRITPPSRGVYDQSDIKKLSLERKPWLPAIRVFGEGIFLILRKEAIESWQKDDVILERVGILEKNQRHVSLERGIAFRKLLPKYFLLHTFAHILIRRLSFECGYGSSSLRERIYCDDGNGNGNEMSGILIYTAAGDCEGTLGGLVRQAKPGRFEDIITHAVTDALWCASNPICIESRGQGSDSLNLAACHACALLPETSCEEGNRLLDRGMLIGTIEKPECGFFKSLVEDIIIKS
jgi:hypothetical protein